MIEPLHHRIRRTRRDLGLSQGALAGAAGVSLATVQNVEAGTANPALSTLESLLEPLGLAVAIESTEADWDALADHGLPLLRRRTGKGRSIDGGSLRDHVGRAALEVSRVPGTPERERKHETLQALLLAVRLHFPDFYRRAFGRSELIRSLTPESPSGRVVKLARIARDRLAEYL